MNLLLVPLFLLHKFLAVPTNHIASFTAIVSIVTIEILNPAQILKIMMLPVLSTTVLAVYAICGGLLICCLETQLKFLRVLIAVNFGFLFNSVWRFLFYMILGSVCYSYKGLMGPIMGSVMAGVAVFNTYVLCRYPAYRKIREEIAEKEDKQIEDRISKEVKTQALKQMTQSATGKN